MNLLMLILLIVIPSQVTGVKNVPNPSDSDEMNKLAFMIGEWHGSGWIYLGPGNRQTFMQKENIQFKVGGQVMQIDGLGLTRDPETGREIVVHDALGIVMFDKTAGVHRIRAYSAKGGAVDSDFKLDNKTAVWGFEDRRAGGKIRFTLTIDDDGRWIEKGEMTRDGQNWFQFIEMKLERKK